MSDPTKAVFLSYASQDAEAVKRICDALRAAGVEVWFDQNELVGGDSWDAKIRGQIGSCALFVPVISAATQARREGYFRLEWKLAAQRTHMIADGTPFIVPVVIDATRDPEALVPAEFKSVQWSRLPAGGPPAVFVARMRQLLEGGGAAEATLPAETPPAARPAPRKTRWVGYGWAAVGIGFALFYAFRPVWSPPRTLNEPRPASQAPKLTAAETLVAKARALLADDPLTTRASVLLAEQLAREAVTLNQSNAEAHAVLAWANYVLISERYDDTPQRRTQLREHAEKARLLAPDSVSAEFAMCCHLQMADSRTEAQARLQALVERAPDNLPVLVMSARAQIGSNRDISGSAGDRYTAELAKLRAVSPLGRAHAEALAAGAHWGRGEYVESDRANDRGFATGSPVRLNYLFRLLVLLYGWGDLPAARAFVETIPSQLLLEDVFIAHVSTLWLYSGESDKALKVLARTPREMLSEAAIFRPTAMLRGNALAAAGRPAAAAVQWREAQRVVDQHLAADPANTSLLYQKAELLASLGDRAGAATAFALDEETSNEAEGSIDWASSYSYFARLGDVDAALERLDRYVSRDHGRWANVYNQLRHDPMFAKVRADPRAQPILERGARWLEEMKSGRSTSSPAASAAALPLADDKSVAVLAFANLSDDKANEYFSDGISEELLNVLAKVPGLKVTARTSSFHFKGKDTPIPEIAKQLSVAYIIEGSVRKAGDKVRITAQLIKAADGFHVWSDTFTRDLKDIFAVQDEIAGLIAKNLKLKLEMGVERAQINPEAYGLLLQGRFFARQESNAGRKQSLEYYRRAIGLEPGYALAWAELAQSYIRLARFGGMLTAEGMREARVAAQKSLDLDPDQPSALEAMGWVQRTADWDWRAAQRTFQRSLTLAPEDPSLLTSTAILYRNVGRLAEAMALARQAVERDPLNAMAQINLGDLLMQSGRAPESIESFSRGIKLAPQVEEFRSHQAIALAQINRFAEADAQVEQEPNEAYRFWGRGIIAGLRGDRDAVARAREALLAKHDPSMTGYVAMLFAAEGKHDEAFTWLERSVSERDSSVCWIKTATYYEALKNDPRWPDILRKVGLADDQLK